MLSLAFPKNRPRIHSTGHQRPEAHQAHHLILSISRNSGWLDKTIQKRPTIWMKTLQIQSSKCSLVECCIDTTISNQASLINLVWKGIHGSNNNKINQSSSIHCVHAPGSSRSSEAQVSGVRLLTSLRLAGQGTLTIRSVFPMINNLFLCFWLKFNKNIFQRGEDLLKAGEERSTFTPYRLIPLLSPFSYSLFIWASRVS